jgi:hypothetical protein
VDERDLVRGGRAGAEGDEVRRAGQVVEEDAEAVRPLGMPATWIVRQHARIEDDPGAARHPGDDSTRSRPA